MRASNVRRLVMAGLFLLSIITYLDRVCISVAAPAMQKDLQMSPSQLGLVFGIFTLAYGLFEVPGGWMGDRFGPRRVLTRIVVWWSAFTALTGSVTSFSQLLTVRFLFGAGEAGAYPNCSGAISRWFPTVERARAHGLVWMASRLGGALAPLLVIPLQQAYGWRSVFHIFSVIGLIWAVGWFVWFRDDPREKSGVNEAELALIGAGGGPAQRLPFRAIAMNRNLWAVMLMYHFFCYGSYWYIAWTPTYLVEAKNMSGATLATYSALPFLLGAAANGIGGVFGDSLVRKMGLKRGRRIVGAAGVGLGGVFMIVSLFIANPYLAATVLALGFAASDFMLPTCWAVCLDIGKESAGTVTGAMNMAGQMGATIMSYGFGVMVETYGWNWPLLVIGGLSLLSAALWLKIDPTRPIRAGKPEVVPALAQGVSGR
jgi:MFS transporter, ACS family, glucarate transporter